MMMMNFKNRVIMKQSNYYLGIDVGGTNIVAGVVDENYNIITREGIPTRSGESLENIIEDIVKCGRLAVVKAGMEMESIRSWGIGMPSNVNPKNNLLVHANCFGWKNVPVYDCLKRHISHPIYIANDANCAVYGEVLAGIAKQYRNAIMLTLGTGVGGGIILDKRIYSGADNMGAELGHTKLVYDGTLCTCGQRGCLEAYCSATALIRDAKDSLDECPDSIMLRFSGYNKNNINGKIIFDSAKAGDALAIKLVNCYVNHLAAGISTFITIFRPEVVILGGGLSHAGSFLIDALNEQIAKCTFGADEMGVPPIVTAQLGNAAGIIGAAMLSKMSNK